MPIPRHLGSRGLGSLTVRGTHIAGASLEDALRTLASLEVLPIAQRQLAEEAADKLAGSGLYVAVIGEFKRGKTTLINALLGADLLPTGVLPVTAVPALVALRHAATSNAPPPRRLGSRHRHRGAARLPHGAREPGEPQGCARGDHRVSGRGCSRAV